MIAGQQLRRFVTVLAGLLLLWPFVYIVMVYRESYEIISRELVFRPNLSTALYDSRGELIAELFNENRRYVKLDRMSPHIIHAFIVAEDRDFYRHGGFDMMSMLRALVVNTAGGGVRQGGSTITQQLAKQLYAGPERSVRRKINELFIALALERQYDKDHIIEMYLNQIYFGHGVYGVSSACRFFFGHEVDSAGAAESAVLAAIPPAPGRFSPLKNPAASMSRSRRIMEAMAGAGLIGRDQGLGEFSLFWNGYSAVLMTRSPSESVNSSPVDRAPHFTDYVRRVLIGRYGEEMVLSGGLKVYTTLDLRQQEIAQRVISSRIAKQRQLTRIYNRGALADIDRTFVNEYRSGKRSGEERSALVSFYREMRRSGLDELALLAGMCNATGEASFLNGTSRAYESLLQSAEAEGAFLALDVKSGGITAMVGGGDVYVSNQLNRAIQSYRQPGSAFKAFVYGAGIALKKISPATSFLDLPLVFREGGREWTPSNYEKNFRGQVLARKALAASLNVTSIAVYEKTGGAQIARFASGMMGIPHDRFTIDPTLALGTSELSLMEMVRGFAVYARDGMAVSPHAIIRIVDRDGRLIYERAPDKNSRLLSRETAYVMTSLLRDVVDRGTASGAVRKKAGFILPAAGKTGTNTRYRDAWFVGYTPDLVAGVWFGCDSQIFSLGPGQSGSEVAAPVWGEFMRDVYHFREKGRFSGMPDGVISLDICEKTGKLAASGCTSRREIFLNGTEPLDKCPGDHSEITGIMKKAREQKEILLDRERDKSDRRSAEKQGMEIEEHFF